MTKRELPAHPHPQHLRKQAKARLAILRQKSPHVRLADAQFLLAREYGFSSWRELQAEVASRGQSPRLPRRRVRRARVRALYPARHLVDGRSDPESESHAAFFGAGATACIGFFVGLIVGAMGILTFLLHGPEGGAQALMVRLAQLLRGIL